MKSPSLTVLVFKDNLSARTLQVPLGWLSRLSALLVAVVLVAVGMSFLAFRFYRTARTADPTRIQELQVQLTQAIQEKSDAVKRLQAIPTVVAQPPPQPVAAPAPVAVVAPQPIPTVTVTITPEPVSAASIPNSVSRNVPNTTAADGASLSIGIDAPKITWAGKSLRVHFAIAYVRDDHGNQQGHIVVLARGPATLLAYPDEVLNLTDTENLIVPAKGEYFSVSRFREVNAEFPQIRAPGAIREIEALIYDSDGRLLIHRKIPTP